MSDGEMVEGDDFRETWEDLYVLMPREVSRTRTAYAITAAVARGEGKGLNIYLVPTVRQALG